MPTPVQAFIDVAVRHGGVDPSDMEAVRRFYRETLPTLAPKQILGILEGLLAQEGQYGGTHPEPFYPTGAALPSCRSSPAVPVPFFAHGWREILLRLLRRRTR